MDTVFPCKKESHPPQGTMIRRYGKASPWHRSLPRGRLLSDARQRLVRSVLHEALLPQRVEERPRHGLVVATRVPYVGEHLRERLLVVHPHELLVLRQRLLGGVEPVYEGCVVVAVCLAVQYRLHRQAVGLRRVLAGPPERQRRHGHHEARQAQHLDYLLRHVHRGAEVAIPEPLLIGEVAERLRIEQRVARRVDERQEIVVARQGAALLGPPRRAAEIGAEREHHRGLRHHWLVEVRRRQLALLLLRPRHHDAVKLQVSHCLGALGLTQQPREQLLAHVHAGIFPDAPSLVK